MNMNPERLDELLNNFDEQYNQLIVQQQLVQIQQQEQLGQSQQQQPEQLGQSQQPEQLGLIQQQQDQIQPQQPLVIPEPNPRIAKTATTSNSLKQEDLVLQSQQLPPPLPPRPQSQQLPPPLPPRSQSQQSIPPVFVNVLHLEDTPKIRWAAFEVTDSFVDNTQTAPGKYIFICFRGTSNTTDVIIDGSYHPQLIDGLKEVRAHGGIYSNLRAHLSSIRKVMSSLIHQNPNHQVFFTGHSLGGAYASSLLVSLLGDTEHEPNNNDITFDVAKFSLLTFGAPLILFEKDSIVQVLERTKQKNVILDRCYSFVNGEDVVPRILGNELPFINTLGSNLTSTNTPAPTAVTTTSVSPTSSSTATVSSTTTDLSTSNQATTVSNTAIDPPSSPLEPNGVSVTTVHQPGNLEQAEMAGISGGSMALTLRTYLTAAAGSAAKFQPLGRYLYLDINSTLWLVNNDEQNIRFMLGLNWLQPQKWITDHGIKFYCSKIHSALVTAHSAT